MKDGVGRGGGGGREGFPAYVFIANTCTLICLDRRICLDSKETAGLGPLSLCLFFSLVQLLLKAIIH